MKTKYISIEGGDGSGKTTLVKNLHNHFLSLKTKILLTKEFGSPHDKFCQELRSIALSDQYSVDEKAGQILFGAIIKQHQEKVIKPAFGNYEVILSDRGPYSNYTYGPVHKIEDAFINELFDLVYKDAKWPDISIFLNLPTEVATKRRLARSPEAFQNGGVDRVEAKGSVFQEGVRDNFLKIAKKDDRLVILTLTEDMTPEDVLKETLSLIKSKLG